MRFHDRSEAGKLLAEKLSQYASRTDVIVLALPPGGVPIGYEVAKALNTSLDILVIRSLRLPSNPELAMGAVCADGALALNQEIRISQKSPKDRCATCISEQDANSAKSRQVNPNKGASKSIYARTN